MTINQITPAQLKSPDIFQGIKQLVQPFIFYAETKDAFDLSQKLERLLNASGLETYSSGLFKQYNLLLVRLKFVALPFLPDDEATDLIRENLFKVIKDAYTDYNNAYIDVENRIWAKMVLAPFFPPRDELRQSFNKAIRGNKEILGTKMLGAWVDDYSRTFDFRERTSLSPMNYINQNPEANALSEQDKNILRQILRIFDQYLIVTPLVDFFGAQEIYQELIKEEYEAEKKQPLPPVTPSPTPPLPKIEPIKTELRREVPREPIPEFKKEIKTFPLEIEKILEEEPKEESQPRRVGGYQIRTMKTDIEKTKKQPIPPKPQPKIKDNIVDLSGK